jgi:hypothetical protein
VIDPALTIRAATPRDAGALSQLAALDIRPPLGGRTLLAERDGVAIAAVALTSGAVVADPFHAGTDAVRQLRFRRYQLLRQGGDTGPAQSLLRRLAPATG